jgi:flagellar assembly protein FliH
MSLRAKRLVQPSKIAEFNWSTLSPSGDPVPSHASVLRQETVSPAPAAVPEPDPAEHQARLAALERDAFAKGFAQGERAGAEAARERGEAMLRRLTQTIDELMALRERMIHQTERQMVQLALAVARRVVHREVSLDQDLLVAMARVALERLGESARVTVRFHPEEFEAISAARANDWAGTSVSVVADPRVGRGGCRVESEFGTMDAGVDAQIQELARALLGEEDAGGTNGQ